MKGAQLERNIHNPFHIYNSCPLKQLWQKEAEDQYWIVIFIHFT